MRREQQTRKSILGYHDKEVNQYTLINDDLPILLDELYSPFLITNSHHYNITTREISNLINAYKKIEAFRKFKNQIAQALIIPGLLIALIYTANSLGLFSSNLTDFLLNKKLANITFWISMIGVVILWHDYYRNRSHPVRIPKTELIDEKTHATIQNVGIEFEKYIQTSAIYYLQQDTQDLLVEFTSSNGIDTFDLLKSLMQTESIKELLNRADINLTLENFEEHQISSEMLPTYPLASIRSIIIYALDEALLSNTREIRPIHIFLAYMRVFPALKVFLKNQNSSHDLLREIVWFMMDTEAKVKSVNIFNVNFPYYKTGGIGNTWVYGYTFVLNKFSTDLNQKVLHIQDIFGIGHDREVDELVSVLGRLSKNNALLIGEPGVGKSSLIKGVAQRINRGKVPTQLEGKRIIQLDINALIALSTGEKNVEANIQKAMSELEAAGNTILYIDEIQEIIPAKANESGHSLAGILLPYILDGKFPIVGSINYQDYKKYFYQNESLRNSFETVEVSELSPSDTLKILQTKVNMLQDNYGLYITFPALTTAIELSQRYITDRKLPDSAVNTIEAACSWAQASKFKRVGSEQVAKSVALQTNIPVDDITVEEATNLMNLEDDIKQKVIGQDEAVHSVVESLKRSRADIRDPNKPIGVFLFMGPTGTGKTHLSNTLTQEYFGKTSQMIRVDMSEYQELSSIEKILGANSSSEYSGGSVTILDKVKKDPHSVILFDEIEKAHPQILDLFLQLFDEGRLTSNNGETVNFTNTIIICTSNIGSRQLLEALERDRAMWEEAKQSALLEVRGAIRPELLNRFDKIIVFSPHDITNLVKITELILDKLAGRLSSKGLSLQWDESIPMLIANRAQEPGMGARPIKRFVQEKIETKIADSIINSTVQSGEVIDIKESWLI